MINQINELLKDQDNSEKIRDRIAAILKIELDHQKKLAEDLNINNKNDFNIKVYVENSRPWELTSNYDEFNPFPLVNVCLQELGKPSGEQNIVKCTGTYYIDCYACGNIQPENTEEYIPDDSLSTMRAWQTARIVRNILMSGFYTFLNMQEIVRKRLITKIETIVPNNQEAISITVCRMFFEIDFYENSIAATPNELQEILFECKDDGEVSLFEVSSINPDDDKE